MKKVTSNKIYSCNPESLVFIGVSGFFLKVTSTLQKSFKLYNYTACAYILYNIYNNIFFINLIVTHVTSNLNPCYYWELRLSWCFFYNVTA